MINMVFKYFIPEKNLETLKSSRHKMNKFYENIIQFFYIVLLILLLIFVENILIKNMFFLNKIKLNLVIMSIILRVFVHKK